jgi:hypothetical protein
VRLEAGGSALAFLALLDKTQNSCQKFKMKSKRFKVLGNNRVFWIFPWNSEEHFVTFKSSVGLKIENRGFSFAIDRVVS